MNVDSTHTAHGSTMPPTGGQELPDTRHVGPTVPRMTLGLRLRELREEGDMSRDHAAAALGVSRDRISRLERGRTGCDLGDLHALLHLYGVTDQAERATLAALAEQASQAGWWQPYSDVIPPWLPDFLGAEQAANVIRTFEVQFVPGLLQTPAYARAVIRLGHPGASAGEVERRVELRTRRQEILHRPHPPHLWVVIDEGALRRPVGGTAVLRDQLDHLATMAGLPHITVQVLPFAIGGHAALCGAVTMLRLPGGQLPDMVYLEQLSSAVYPERPAEVHQYWDVLNRLVVDAERAASTPAWLRTLRATL